MFVGEDSQLEREELFVQYTTDVPADRARRQRRCCEQDEEKCPHYSAGELSTGSRHLFATEASNSPMLLKSLCLKLASLQKLNSATLEDRHWKDLHWSPDSESGDT